MLRTVAGAHVSAAFVGGAVSGAIMGAAAGYNATGTLAGALKGAAIGGVTGSVTAGFTAYTNYMTASMDAGERIALRSLNKGVTNKMMGGSFDDGFNSGLVAGTANYIYTSAVKYEMTLAPGGKAVPKTLNSEPSSIANNIGCQDGPCHLFGINFQEGSTASRILNMLPGVNGVAGLHDVFQINMSGQPALFFLSQRSIFNIPYMVPAAGFSFLAEGDTAEFSGYYYAVDAVNRGAR